MSGPLRDPLGRVEPLLPSEWLELAPLVDLVLDAAPEQRATLVVELSAGDPARQRALEQLVADCEREMPLLDRAARERFDVRAFEPEDALLPERPRGPVPDRARTGAGRDGARVRRARHQARARRRDQGDPAGACRLVW